MVATRRGTRVEPGEDESSPGQQAAMDSTTQASPKRVQRIAKNDPPAEDSVRNGEDQEESTGIIGSPSKNDSKRGLSQVVTRSRNRSGQSDADVSEAESTTSTSSRRVTRSRQSFGSVTDSARKLRNHMSAVITEPILESIEDEELSEAESNCSSVSTRARRMRACALRSTRTKSRKSLLAEPVSDLSEAESNCSSVSGLQIATRSTRASRPLSVNRESHKEEVSEAESCNSDFVPQTQTRRSSRRVQSQRKAGEAKIVSESSSQESPKKQRYSLRGVKVIEPSVQEEEIVSTPCRTLRNMIVNECSDVIVLSDAESQSQAFENQNSLITKSKDKESLKESLPDSSAEPSSVLEQKLPETSPSANDASNEMIDLTEEVNEPQLEDQCRPVDDDEEEEEEDGDSETAEIINEGSPNLNAKTQSGCSSAISTTEKVEISLLLDSEKSEDSEEEADLEMEEEEYHEDLLKKKKLKQSQNVVADGLFVIDTAPGLDSSKKYYVDHHEDDQESEREQDQEEEMSEPDEEEEDFIDEEVEDDDEEQQLLTRPKSGFELSTSIDTGINIKQMGGLYINFDAEKANPGSNMLKKLKKESKTKDELLKKSIITPDFEKKESVPPYKESLNKLKKLRREEQAKTTGQGWFNMKAPEMTEELKNDLKALKMRSAMDPKHFYKKNDREGFPKYFQVGTIVDSPLDHYHSRIPKKQRKRTIVEELLVDSEFRRYNKKKYQEIMAEKAARAEGKKNRKKRKFRT